MGKIIDLNEYRKNHDLEQASVKQHYAMRPAATRVQELNETVNRPNFSSWLKEREEQAKKALAKLNFKAELKSRLLEARQKAGQAKETVNNIENKAKDKYREMTYKSRHLKKEPNLFSAVKEAFSNMPGKMDELSQKEAQAQLENTPNAAPSRLKAFFASFKQDPKGKTREIAQKAQMQAKKGIKKLRHLPEFFKAAELAATGKLIKVGEKGIGKLKDKQQAIKQNTLKLNQPNMQGLKLIKDPEREGAYRFEATRKVHMRTGLINKDGSPNYFTLKPGETTGMIIPKGKDNLNALARASQGQKRINFALDHDSTLTMEKGLAQPDIFTKKSGNGLIKNSDLVLSGAGTIDHSTIINTRDAEIGNKFERSALKKSRHVGIYAPVSASVINHSASFLTHGDVHNSVINSSYVQNSGQGVIDNATINSSSVKLHNKDFIGYSDLNNTTVENSSVVSKPDKPRSVISRGQVVNSAVITSRLDMSDVSRIVNSDVAMSQFVSNAPNSSRFSVVDSSCENAIMAPNNGGVQSLNGTAINNALVYGDAALDKCDIRASQEKPAFIRDSIAKNIACQTQDKTLVLTDKILASRHLTEVNDENLRFEPNEHAQAVSKFMAKEVSGMNLANGQLKPLNNKQGTMSVEDQLNLISDYVGGKHQEKQEKISPKKFFNLKPEAQKAETQEKDSDIDIS